MNNLKNEVKIGWINLIWFELKYWENIRTVCISITYWSYNCDSVKIGEMWYQFAIIIIIIIIILIPQTEENSASSTRVIGLIGNA